MARTVIAIQCRGWQAFLAAFGILRAAGVDVTAVGGNAMTVPHDTDRAVLRSVASTGAVVHADLTETAPTGPRQTALPQAVEMPPAASAASISTEMEAASAVPDVTSEARRDTAPPQSKPDAVRKPRQRRKPSTEE